MVCWSWKDCQNAQHEILQFLHQPTKACLEAQDRLTDFIVGTAKRGYIIKPKTLESGMEPVIICLKL